MSTGTISHGSHRELLVWKRVSHSPARTIQAVEKTKHLPSVLVNGQHQQISWPRPRQGVTHSIDLIARPIDRRRRRSQPSELVGEEAGHLARITPAEILVRILDDHAVWPELPGGPREFTDSPILPVSRLTQHDQPAIGGNRLSHAYESRHTMSVVGIIHQNLRPAYVEHVRS